MWEQQNASSRVPGADEWIPVLATGRERWHLAFDYRQSQSARFRLVFDAATVGVRIYDGIPVSSLEHEFLSFLCIPGRWSGIGNSERSRRHRRTWLYRERTEHLLREQ